MSVTIRDSVLEMDALVSKGDMVTAINRFFSENASTSDYGQTTTEGKPQMVEKMQSFLGGIAAVNEITHHATLVDGQKSASEFTFNFSMKDGSTIHWHEIIRRVWNEDGKVVNEEYFNTQN